MIHPAISFLVDPTAAIEVFGHELESTMPNFATLSIVYRRYSWLSPLPAFPAFPALAMSGPHCLPCPPVPQRPPFFTDKGHPPGASQERRIQG